MRRLFSFFAVIAITAITSYAQVTTVPVDPLTGRLALTLPITELNSGSIGIPVVLVYTAGSGVKVDAGEGSAGVGWDIAGSGAIRRELRALPDDYKGRGSDARRGWLQGTSAKSLQTFSPSADDDLSTCADEFADFNFVNALSYNIDPEPDLFSFSAPGLSGQFMFDADGVPRPVPYQDIKISPTRDSNGAITTFDITTNTGVIYSFNSRERSSRQTKATNRTVNYFTAGYGYYTKLLSYVSSWNLSSMVSPDGSKITYHYRLLDEAGSQHTTSVVSESGTARDQYTTVDKIEKSELDYIQSNLNILSFTWSDHHVTGIELEDTKGNSLGLKYSFTYGAYRDQWSAGVDMSVDGTRHFLLRVNQESNCSAYPAYEFLYNGLDDDNGTISLPFSTGGRADLWGYGNGTSASAIPPLYENTAQTDGERLRVIPLADEDATLTGDARAVDEDYITSGLPSAILYPTGSSTYIQYEPNTYFDAAANKNRQGGGVRVKSVRFETTTTEYYYNTSGNATAGEPTSGKLSYPPSYAFVDGTSRLRTTIHLGPESYVLYSRAVVRQSGKGRTVYDYDLPAMYPANAEQDWNATRSRVIRPVTATNNPSCSNVGNQSNGYYTYPFAPTTNYEFERGLPRLIADYSETGAKVQERAYTYQRLTPGTIVIKGIRLERLAGNLVYGAYSMLTNTGKVVQSETLRRADELNPGFDPVNPTNMLASTTTYTYSDVHQMLQSVSVVNSDAVVSATNFRYAKDFDGLTDPNTAKPEAVGMKLLNAANRHGTPIETQTTRGGSLTGAAITLYKDFGNNKVLPSWKGSYPQGSGFTALAVQNDDTGKQELVFSTQYLASLQSYSAVGGGMSVRDYRQKRAGVLYDVKGELPYATVSNALSEEVVYEGFEDETPRMTVTKGTRTAQAAWAGGWGERLTSATTIDALNVVKGAKRYRASCWVLASTAANIIFEVTSGTTSDKVTMAYEASDANHWKYLEASIDMTDFGNAFNLQVRSTAGADMDEVRFYPADAVMTTYSYNVLKNKIAEVGERGEAAFSSYDDLNRVSMVQDQNKDVRLLKDYNFSNNPNKEPPVLTGGLSPAEWATLIVNKAKTFTAASNNCITGVGYTWKINGQPQAADTQTLTYTPTATGKLTVSVTVSYPTMTPVTTETTYCIQPTPLTFSVSVRDGKTNPNVDPSTDPYTNTISPCHENNKRFTASTPKGGCGSGFSYEWQYVDHDHPEGVSVGTGKSISFNKSMTTGYTMYCTVTQSCDCVALSVKKGQVIGYDANDNTNCE